MTLLSFDIIPRIFTALKRSLFLHLPVSHSVHGGVGGSTWAGTPLAGTPPLGRYPPGRYTPLGQVPPWQVHTPLCRYTPMAGTPPQAGTFPPQAGTPWQIHPPAGTPNHSACWDMVNKQVVRIPLECILVLARFP